VHENGRREIFAAAGCEEARLHLVAVCQMLETVTP
jgi:hypothetical protein